MTETAGAELAQLIREATRPQLEQMLAALLDAVIQSERGESVALKWVRKAVRGKG